MPYIPQDDRDKFSAFVREISKRVSVVRQDRPGEMNYIISSLIRAVYGEHPRYADYNEIVGVLECAKLELYRTRAAIYEDKKKIEAGDIYVDNP